MVIMGRVGRTGFFSFLSGWLSSPRSWFILGFIHLMASPIAPSSQLNSTYQGNVFYVDFTAFSPAFGAFEDEFLFPRASRPPLPLKTGQTRFFLKRILASKKIPSLPPKPTPSTPPRAHHHPSPRKRLQQGKLQQGRFQQGKVQRAKVQQAKVQRAKPSYLWTPIILHQSKNGKTQNRKAQRGSGSFDGEISMGEYKEELGKKLPSPLAFPLQLGQSLVAQALKPLPPIQAEELGFGPLASTVYALPSRPSPKGFGRTDSLHHKNSQAQGTLGQKGQPKPHGIMEGYKISGGIELKGGLAFFGSMDINWMVGDHKIQGGSINAPDATYGIEVPKLMGNLTISLYDQKDHIIGEGVLDLNRVPVERNHLVETIEVLPVNWDTAGLIIQGNSLGSGVNKGVSHVEVALYAFNEATQTDSQGAFRFYNWKKTNSRTLAIASKEGFRDSIFTLDSKTEAQVLLFEEKYFMSFFSFLETLGLYGVADEGLVYGQITGVPDLSGYRVRMEGAQPVYFMGSGFASLEQGATSGNGLFSFVGLEDGDYELFIEKDGEVMDQRIVAVEQGKCSPVLVDLSKVSKTIEFFDPMEPDRVMKTVDIHFFDGSTIQSLDSDGMFKKKLTQGHDLGIMDFFHQETMNRSLLSRHTGLQKIPLFKEINPVKLARQAGYSVEDGLIVGFIQAPVPYKASLVETQPDQVIYFNGQGLAVPQGDQTVVGFVMAGFNPGLNSLLIESLEETPLILGTDLVYSNHQSINVTHLELRE